LSSPSDHDRLQCAGSGHLRTPERTGMVHPKLAFEFWSARRDNSAASAIRSGVVARRQRQRYRLRVLF
jgi:hypothetical protein